MTNKENDPVIKEPYRVVTVEKIQPPEGMPGNNWHRYVIGRDNSASNGRTNSTIDGIKPGTLKSVTDHANSVANDLNERAGKGGSYFAPSHRQNKKTN